MHQTIFLSLLLTLVIGAQASAIASKNMDDDPAVAQFALEIVQLELEVSVDKPIVSTTSKLRIDLWLANDNPNPFNLLLGVGEIERPYSLRMVTSMEAGYIPWGSGITQIYRKPEQIMIIQPGKRYEDTHVVDLDKIKDLKTGAYTVNLNFKIDRYIGGKLRRVILNRRSKPFEIIADPTDIMPTESPR